MKLIIRDYLASLKERDELDAILPDLLSELGYVVFSVPRRGTTQYGVDIAAVGSDVNGERRVFLFTLKQGDLTRQDWDGTPQSLRASLNEIKDVYIPTRLPDEYKALNVVICLCFGGNVQEQVRAALTGYTKENTTERISYSEWNGDKIAEMLLRGILREEILPKNYRSSFQKSVAMVDEPDVAYRHFSDLITKFRDGLKPGDRARVTVARQLYICLWIIFVWARDINNVEAPYRISELVILNVWDLLRPFIGQNNSHAKAINAVLHQLIQLQNNIASELLTQKIGPHVDKRDGLSFAIPSRTYADINLKLFDLLGRIAMAGLWQEWLAQQSGVADYTAQEKIIAWSEMGIKLIRNNPALLIPLQDQQATEVALFLILLACTGRYQAAAKNWLNEIVNRIDITIRMQGKYPSILSDYKDLIDHPKERSQEYLEEVTSGSVLLPLLIAWLSIFNEGESLQKICELKKSKLAHCTFQFWLPDTETEENLYIGKRGHGIALCDLPASETGNELLEIVDEGCKKADAFYKLSAVDTGYWPIILLACRHYRYPVPPHMWINLVKSNMNELG